MRAVDKYAGLTGQMLCDLSRAYAPSAGIYLAGSLVRALMAHTSAPNIDVLCRPFDVSAAQGVPVRVISGDAVALAGFAGF